MKNFKQAVISFVLESLYMLAPYTVRNVEFGKCHYCWTYADALEWLAAYDARDFGVTNIHDWNGEIIAYKAA